MVESMLEISQLRAGYGAINVLWDVSLSIQKGKLTTIIGPNGAGKTTLLRTIMGLLPVGAGSIAPFSRVLLTPTTRVASSLSCMARRAMP